MIDISKLPLIPLVLVSYLLGLISMGPLQWAVKWGKEQTTLHGRFRALLVQTMTWAASMVTLHAVKGEWVIFTILGQLSALYIFSSDDINKGIRKRFPKRKKVSRLQSAPATF